MGSRLWKQFLGLSYEFISDGHMVQTFLMGPGFQLGPWVQFNWLSIIGRPLLKPFSSALVLPQQKIFPEKLISRQNVQPSTITRRGYKGKNFVTFEQIHVGSETGSGSRSETI